MTRPGSADRRNEATVIDRTQLTEDSPDPDSQQRAVDYRTGGHIGERYRVSQLLGRGGMAEVYLARDIILNRKVAIKILRPERVDEPGMIERFQREARSVANLDHPGIVSILAAGDSLVSAPESNLLDRPYIVMEYIKGHTVRSLLKDQTSTSSPLSIDRAIQITSKVLSALGYSHDHRVVHGDVTATNVMLTTKGEVKLIDFGSSAQVVTEAGATMPLAHDATLRYVSPERAQGELFDTRADLYSAGCLLYELLTGRTPFEGSSPVDLAYQHVHQRPKPPSRYRSQVGPKLDAVVLRALAKAPDARHHSAAHLRGELAAVQSQEA